MGYNISSYGSKGRNPLSPILEAIQYNRERAEDLRRWEAQHAIDQEQMAMSRAHNRRQQREFDAEIYNKEFKNKALKWGDIRYKRVGSQRVKRSAHEVITDPRFMPFLTNHGYSRMLGPERGKYSDYQTYEVKPGLYAIGMKNPDTGKVVPLSSSPDGRDPQTFTQEQAEGILNTLEEGIRKQARYGGAVSSLDQELDRGLVGTVYDPQRRAARAEALGMTAPERMTAAELQAIEDGYTGKRYSRSHRANLDPETLRKIEQIDSSVEGQAQVQLRPEERQVEPVVETKDTQTSGNYYQQLLATGDGLSDFERTKFEHNAAVLADIEQRYEAGDITLGEYNAEIEKASKQKIGGIPSGLVQYGTPAADDAWWDGAYKLGGEAVDWAFEYAKENPGELASYGLMFIPGLGWVATGYRAIKKLAKAKKWGKRSLQALKGLNVAGRRAMGTTTRKWGGKTIPLNKKTYTTKAQAESALRRSNFDGLDAHKVVQNSKGEWTLAPTVGNIATSKGTMFAAGAAGLVASSDGEQAKVAGGAVSPAQQARAEKAAETMSRKEASKLLTQRGRYAKFKQLSALKVLQDAEEIPADSVANFMETGTVTLNTKELADLRDKARKAKKDKQPSYSDFNNSYEFYAEGKDNPYFSQLEHAEFTNNTRIGGFALNPNNVQHGQMLARALKDLERAVRSGGNDWIPWNETEKSDINYQSLDPFIALRLMNRRFSDSELDTYGEQLHLAFKGLNPGIKQSAMKAVAELVREHEMDVDTAIANIESELSR